MSISNQTIQKSYKIQPTPMRINADNSNKRNVTCFWAIFILIVIASVLLSCLGPVETITKTNQTELNQSTNECRNPYGFENDRLVCNQFSKYTPKLGLILKDLTILHQNALIKLELDKSSKPKNQTLSIELHRLKEVRNETHIQFQDGGIVKSQTLLFQTLQKDNFIIGYYRHLRMKNYLLVIKFEKVDGLIQPQLKVVLCIPQAVLVNPAFSIFIIVVRGLFFVIGLLATIFYLFCLRKIPGEQIIIEQKLVIALSISLLFFNDPTYSVTILFPTMASTLLSTIFVVQFVIVLIFFWIYCCHRIRHSEGTTHYSLPKRTKILYILYFIIFFSLFAAFYSSIAVHQFKDKIIIPPYKLSLPLFILFFICLAVVFVHLLWAYIKILSEGKNSLWRSSVWMGFTLYFVLVLIVSLILEAVGEYTAYSTKILIFYVGMNTYVLYMQYMFTVSNKENEIKLYKAVESENQLQNSEIISDSVIIEIK